MNESTDSRTGIILTFESLGASHLGPYGNTWYETMTMNRLASQSIVFDRMIADSSDYHQVLSSLLTGVHAASLSTSSPDNLASVVARNGGSSLFVSDDTEICSSELVSNFDRVVVLETKDVSAQASTASETQLALFFAQVIELIDDVQMGDLCWVHCRGLAGMWDAPVEYRRQLAGPDDPEPGTDVKPPVCQIDSNDDSPDKLLGFQMACAAQVRLLDELLSVFMERVDTGAVSGQSVFCCLALSGYPLGEHDIVGPNESLHNESVHLPCFVRWPTERKTHSRNLGLQQPSEIFQVLNGWFASLEQTDVGVTSSGELLPNCSREVAIATSNSGQMIETHAWKLVRTSAGRKLFVRPDDRWEVNDILDRCVGIADELEEILGDQLDKMQAGATQVRIELQEHLAFVDD